MIMVCSQAHRTGCARSGQRHQRLSTAAVRKHRPRDVVKRRGADMLDLVGEGKALTCNGVSRRDFLKVGTLGAIGLSLPQYLLAKEQGAVDPKDDDRACIMIFNLGAPSHIDTFDMKPEAPAEIRGPFQPIKTKSSDFQVSEIFPRHAQIADKFSLVRSCYHTGAAVHDAGWQMMQTGRLFQGGINTPHV